MWEQYLIPSALDEVLDLLADQPGETRPIAGGTDLLLQLQRERRRLKRLVDITRVEELRGVRVDGEGLFIGAGTTFSELLEAALLKEKVSALLEAASTVGSPQIRHMATIGGNVVNASPAADGAVPLVAIGAEAVLCHRSGERRISLEDFFLGPGQTRLKEDELLMGFILAPLGGNSGSAFIKLGLRKALAVAVVSVGAMVRLVNGRVEMARIALGAVAPRILRARAAEEALVGEMPGEQLLEHVGELAAAESSPISDIRASAEYRREMVAVLTGRALRQAIARADKSL
ncbi:MAG: FAD binding domain-containing protein [Anaerolineae bacterium]